MAIILRYFAEFGSFRGHLRNSAWLISHQQIFPRAPRNVIVHKNKHDGCAVLFAVAEVLVTSNLCSARDLSRMLVTLDYSLVLCFQ